MLQKPGHSPSDPLSPVPYCRSLLSAFPVSASIACASPDARRPHHAERVPAIGTAEGSAALAMFDFTPTRSSACHAPATPVFTYLRPARSRAAHSAVLPTLMRLPLSIAQSRRWLAGRLKPVVAGCCTEKRQPCEESVPAMSESKSHTPPTPTPRKLPPRPLALWPIHTVSQAA